MGREREVRSQLMQKECSLVRDVIYDDSEYFEEQGDTVQEADTGEEFNGTALTSTRRYLHKQLARWVLCTRFCSIVSHEWLLAARSCSLHCLLAFENRSSTHPYASRRPSLPQV
jgi:hypothetical protein